MKKTITGAAFTLFAALTSTTVLAAPDEQKLEKQMLPLIGLNWRIFLPNLGDSSIEFNQVEF